MIAVLDLSWNRLNRGNTKNKAKIKPKEEGLTNGFFDNLKKVFEEIVSIVHMDLSWNRFSKKDSEFIASILNKNQTIFGFHFDGNYGMLNERQFLTFLKVYENTNE